jgi:hypothetical protein
MSEHKEQLISALEQLIAEVKENRINAVFMIAAYCEKDRIEHHAFTIVGKTSSLFDWVSLLEVAKHQILIDIKNHLEDAL